MCHSSTRYLYLTGALLQLLCISTVCADSVVVFNDILYHPSPTQSSDEWIELHNQMAIDVDLSGWSISGGVDYLFPEGTFLKGGEYLLVAANPAALETSAGVAGVFGPFDGQLSNSGELLRLENNAGRIMDEVEYGDRSPWPVAADGSGVTLAKKRKNLGSAFVENWTWSSQLSGTPVAENFPVVDLRPRRLQMVPDNGSWRYNVQGSDLGQGWRQPSFNDSTWQTGQAGFCYGDHMLTGESERIPTLFSSGLDDAGNPLTPGQADLHYRFMSNGSPLVAMQNHPAWLANDTASQWIGFSGQGTESQPAGQFNITTTFDLSGFDPISAVVTLQLSTDNRVDDVLVNGVSTGITCSTFTEWSGPHVISSGFTAGINEITLVFVNEGDAPNPAGLRVKIDGTAVVVRARTKLASCPVTSYFRTSFQYDRPDSANLQLHLDSAVDDGAVFYLNGVEIYRTNMPSDAIDYSTRAVTNVANPLETGEITLFAEALTEGLNTLAVEVHQASGGLNDLFFLSSLSVTETPIPPGEGTKIAFNETTAVNASEYWLEIVNYGNQAIDLAGTVIALQGNANAQYVCPSEALQAGAYRVLGQDELGFRPSADDRLFLYTPQKKSVLDAMVVNDRLQGRLTPGLTRWYYPQSSTPGHANVISVNSDVVINEIMYHKGDIAGHPGEYRNTVLVPLAATARVIVPSDNSLDLDWTGANEPFDDWLWTEGTGNTTGIGYDRESSYLAEIGTNLYSQMFGIRPSFYARIPFNYSASHFVKAMTLRIKYDDGFVAYLNGRKIAERNAPAYPVFDSDATASHESQEWEIIDVSACTDSLKEGANILAIHGLNYGMTSSDLLILPELVIEEEIVPPVPAAESEEEWIELYNRGSDPVDLAGWQIDGGIQFEFSAGTVLDGGEYLLVTRDRDQALADYPSINVVGNFEGRLSNSGEAITLLDAYGNVADEVLYGDDTPWPWEADGYNASLELRHPDADNTNAQSWRASDESSKSQWKTYTYRGIAQPSNPSQPDSQWREFVIGMLDAGRILLDDISVVEDPDGARIQLIQNGTFDASPADSKWRILGTHRHSAVITDPDNALNRVLQLVSTGATDHMHNHLETTLANGQSVVNGSTYEISFRAKWVSGSNQLNTRLYFNRLARTTLIDRPSVNGTPGNQNSCYTANPGPVFSDMTHQPAVPKDYESTIVSVRAADPDGLSQVDLYWRQDGQTWNSVAMTEDQGVFTGSIPPQSTASVVQFYIQAADQDEAVSTYPPNGPESRALYRVDDGLTATNGLHNFRIIMTEADDAWIHTETNVMSNDRIGATVIYDEDEIFYDVGIRLKGSQHHRTPANEVGFNVAFHSDQLFRGVHKTVAIDRSQGVGFGQREILINQAMNYAGFVVSKYSDLIKVIPRRAEHTSAAELQLARYNDEYLDSQFSEGSGGFLYEYELIYYPTTTIGGEEDYKRPLPDIPVGVPIVSLGQDKEDYRWLYLAKNNRKADSFERLMAFTAAFGDSSAAYYEQLADWIDVDQWMSSYAVGVACGAGDNYAGDNSCHNAMFYVRPSDGRVLYFPHDLDYAYDAYRSIVPNSDLNKMIAIPAYERLYYGYLHYFLTTSYNQGYMSYWADHFGGLLAGQNFAAWISFINQRSEYLLSQLAQRIAPKYDFEVIAYDETVDTDYAQVTGRAWIDVHEIRLQGNEIPLDLEWHSEGTGANREFFWTATVALDPGVNELVFDAFGFRGELVGSAAATITSTMQDRPLCEFLKITEIMYAPVGGSDYEFLELRNTGPIPLDMTHVTFTEGITFAFAGSSVQVLESGQYVVIAANPAAFAARYGASDIAVVGPYAGKLANEGETLAVLGQWNAQVFSLTYSDTYGWPLAAAGAGHSLVPLEGAPAARSLDYGAGWRSSTYLGGSPGHADPLPTDTIALNEIMAVSADWIELYNSGTQQAVLTEGYWYLSDNEDNLKKWQIPATIIAPGGWAVFDNIIGFGLDKAGEQVYLSYLPGTGEDRVVDCVRFDGQQAGTSFGRFLDGGPFWQQIPPSPNASNIAPAPHIVISEIMYNPLEGKAEYIELYNPTAHAIALWDEQAASGWRLSDGVDFVFTQGTVLPPTGHLLVVPFGPDEILVSQFTSDYANVPAQIVGPFIKNLSNSGERLALQKPGPADMAGTPDYWITMDEVIYSDGVPWPQAADGTGQSLWRRGLTLSGCDPDAWSSARPSPGTMTCDFNADGMINLSDWASLAENWMLLIDGPEDYVPGDVHNSDHEAAVDINDLLILLDNWLWESLY